MATKKKTAREASTIFHGIMAASVKVNPKEKKAGNYSLPVDEMDIPVKLKIILKNNGVTTLKELASYDAIELLQFKNLGVKSISKIEKAISSYGLSLGDFYR